MTHKGWYQVANLLAHDVAAIVVHFNSPDTLSCLKGYDSNSMSARAWEHSLFCIGSMLAGIEQKENMFFSISKSGLTGSIFYDL